MQIVPLNKRLHDQAVSLEIKAIGLRFSGGNDEGYLDVQIIGHPTHSLVEEIERWAWDAYSYNGAGDGSSYGDIITYDLENNKATHQAWYESVSYGEEISDTLETC